MTNENSKCETPDQAAMFFAKNGVPPVGWEADICNESLVVQNDGWYKYSYLIKPKKIRRAYLKFAGSIKADNLQ